MVPVNLKKRDAIAQALGDNGPVALAGPPRSGHGVTQSERTGTGLT